MALLANPIICYMDFDQTSRNGTAQHVDGHNGNNPWFEIL